MNRQSPSMTSKERLDSIADEIIAIYPEGIISLFKAKDPEEDNLVYLFMQLNTPAEFFMKYSPGYNSIPTHQTELKEMILDKDYQIEERVKRGMELNDLYQGDIVSVFERFDVMSNKIIGTILMKYRAALSLRLKSDNEAVFNQANVLFRKSTGKEEDYFEFDFEDFIIVFCSIIEHYSGLSIHLKFRPEDENKAVLTFYALEEKQFESLAEFFNVELQFKPYAMEYHDKSTKNKEDNGKDAKEEQLLLNNKCRATRQVDDYSLSSPIYWPPYYPFKEELKHNYRLYTLSDDYEESASLEKDSPNSDIDINAIDDERAQINPSSLPLLKQSSKFRNIDKLRLIMRITDYLIKFSYLSQRKILNQIIYKRNHLNYEKHFSTNYIQPNTLHLFDTKLNLRRMHFIRNYFGETMSFYCLWVETYLRWLTVPMLCGLFLKCFHFLTPHIFFFILYDTVLTVDYYDVALLLFGLGLSLWAALFLKAWRQHERFYSYLWGTENYERNNPLNEKYEADLKEELIFGYFCLKESHWKHSLKKYASYFVLGLMIAFTLLFVLGVFHIKGKWLKGIEAYDNNVALVVAIANAIQIKAMNYIYNLIAKKLNNWENHKTQRAKNYSYAIKGIMFEFINNYSALLYIAIVKSSKGICQNNNCFKEIEMQLYTYFAITLALYGVEIGLPFMNQFIKRRQRSSSAEQGAYKLQSIEHLLLCDSGKTLINDYKTVIILFGFVCLFSSAAPLTPLIVFVLLFIGRTIDYYKYSNLMRVDFLDESKGIETYNYVLQFIVFIGMAINVAIILLASPRATSDTMKQFGLGSKMAVFCFTENLIIVLMLIVNWYVLPNWFKKLDTIKELYYSRVLSPKKNKSATMNFSQKNKLLS